MFGGPFPFGHKSCADEAAVPNCVLSVSSLISPNWGLNPSPGRALIALAVLL